MTSRARSARLLVIVALFAVLAIGCNGGTPELGKVTGTVRIDGKPLAGAEVAFHSQKRFPPSYGTTDNLGQYELVYTKDKLGAVVGTHTVQITTQTTSKDESRNEIQIPQRVPVIYNERSELIRRVESGENVFDFDLQSEPEPEEPAAEDAETQEAPQEEGGADEAEAKSPEVERPDAGPAKAEEARAKPSQTDDSLEFAAVTGTVTLNGEPLANADVEFQSSDGPPSYGTTNSSGRFELKYTKETPGAVVGRHVVRIASSTNRTDEQGNEIMVPQLVPSRYNARSALACEVAPGQNVVDFALVSEP